jgi:hypothetical protein
VHRGGIVVFQHRIEDYLAAYWDSDVVSWDYDRQHQGGVRENFLPKVVFDTLLQLIVDRPESEPEILWVAVGGD